MGENRVNMKSMLICLSAVMLLIFSFFAIAAQEGKLIQQRITADEIPWSKSVSNRPGSGMQPGLETVFVVGDGNQKGLFSLVFKVPAHTAVQPHSHPDERSCFVLSGLWYFAYGTVRDETKLKALPPGSNYTEPARAVHFAGTREQEAVVECTAVGPTGTTFVNPADDPRNKK
jgi:hypothetical protein